MKHELKTWPEFFNETWAGRKFFELRHDDRGYRAGDLLLLKEWSYQKGYTGREITCHVTYILSGAIHGLQKDHVVMSIDVLTTDDS